MKRKKIKWKNIFIFLFIIVCISCLSISLYNILKWKKDSNKTNKEIIKIQDQTIIEEIVDTEETKIIEQENIPKTNPYWDYIKIDLININFNELKEINSQTKGWIKVNGTNINYPFVQASNNNYYLTHSFDKTYNGAGWVFLDYRNSINKNDKNIIMYAHGRTDKTMFGSLRNILSSNWLNNKDNYVIKLSTEYENSLWQVFSVYHIPTTSDYINISFSNDDDFLQFANLLISRSSYNFETSVNKNDRILTLSTCYNYTDKVVLHAKLIKWEVR